MISKCKKCRVSIPQEERYCGPCARTLKWSPIVSEVIEEQAPILARLADTTEYSQNLINEPAVKHDQGKPDLSLLPKYAKDQIALALMTGSAKYGRANYLKGMNWTRIIAAADRHLSAFNDGEDLDSESNLSHLAHAGACIMMLLHCYEKKAGTDNRQVGPNNRQTKV